MRDNYGSEIVETIWHDHYTCYQLAHSAFGGYYVNMVTTGQNPVIIAKFESNLPESTNYFFAAMFWNVLKQKNLE